MNFRIIWGKKAFPPPDRDGSQPHCNPPQPTYSITSHWSPWSTYAIPLAPRCRHLSPRPDLLLIYLPWSFHLIPLPTVHLAIPLPIHLRAAEAHSRAHFVAPSIMNDCRPGREKNPYDLSLSCWVGCFVVPQLVFRYNNTWKKESLFEFSYSNYCNVLLPLLLHVFDILY